MPRSWLSRAEGLSHCYDVAVVLIQNDISEDLQRGSWHWLKQLNCVFEYSAGTANSFVKLLVAAIHKFVLA